MTPYAIRSGVSSARPGGAALPPNPAAKDRKNEDRTPGPPVRPSAGIRRPTARKLMPYAAHRLPALMGGESFTPAGMNRVDSSGTRISASGRSPTGPRRANSRFSPRTSIMSPRAIGAPTGIRPSCPGLSGSTAMRGFLGGTWWEGTVLTDASTCRSRPPRTSCIGRTPAPGFSSWNPWGISIAPSQRVGSVNRSSRDRSRAQGGSAFPGIPRG